MKVSFLLNGGELPKKQTSGSSGYDLYSSEDVVIPAGGAASVSLGFSMEFSEGYEAQIRSRSGLSLKKIIVLNSPGTIDSDYRGDLSVLLLNLSDKDFQVKKGDRVAQMVFAKVEFPELKVVSELSETVRGQGGFGSTGIK